MTNPKLIVEVLRPSTEDYDRNEKLEHYKRVPSLSTVVLIDHRSERVELWSRGTTDWSLARFGSGEEVLLSDIRCTLSVDDLYRVAREE